MAGNVKATERQVTAGPGGRILTNANVWSPDGEWILYDTRTDPAGERFDGLTIEMADVRTGKTELLHRSSHEAHCGVATFHPREWKAVFILGPEQPTPDWQYCAWHRQGAIVEIRPGSSRDAFRKGAERMREKNRLRLLDARDVTPPFTPGALRGGSHVHVWDAPGEWVSFTYEDHVLAQFQDKSASHDSNARNVGVSVPGRPVRVRRDHPRNHEADYFSVLVTRTTGNPGPGSDDLLKACEEGWVGVDGYLRADGTRQHRALAFQGQVLTEGGTVISEVFIADLPADLTVPGDGPLEGTPTRLPWPPKGTVQRRLTHTAGRKYPGLQGQRHWLRSSPDGSRIAFLMKDDDGIVQLWTVSPKGGRPAQLTRNRWSIASAFTWSPDGRRIAHIMDHSVCVTAAESGQTTRLTPPSDEPAAPRPEACVFSPDGRKIAYVRHLAGGQAAFNQIFVVTLEE
jgi:hypothetical protein